LHSVTTGTGDKAQALSSRRPDRAQAAYIGDTEYDMHSARAAGFVPIGIAGGYCAADRLHAAGAHAVIDDLEDLPDQLDNLPVRPDDPPRLRQGLPLPPG
jgi:phosphoglycolate phosphatase-like HAD superfamily hydrolase